MEGRRGGRAAPARPHASAMDGRAEMRLPFAKFLAFNVRNPLSKLAWVLDLRAATERLDDTAADGLKFGLGQFACSLGVVGLAHCRLQRSIPNLMSGTVTLAGWLVPLRNALPT